MRSPLLNRRSFLASAAASPLALAQGKKPLTIDSHIHLFDPERFPYHPSATYKPPAATLEAYIKHAAAAGIDHAIIVHPEPYQDDHSYLWHAFENERRTGLFKGTLLLDPIDSRTPARINEYMGQYPDRLVALRVHAMNPLGTPSTWAGPIKDRELASPEMKRLWRAAYEYGLTIQMHFLPHHAPAIGRLCESFRDLPVILDHLGRFGLGQPEDAGKVLALADYPRVIMKFSSPGHSSKQDHPHPDVKPFIQRVYRAFGAGRIIWGSLGHTLADFRRNEELLNFHFDYASEAERLQIRGRNAAELFRFV